MTRKRNSEPAPEGRRRSKRLATSSNAVKSENVDIPSASKANSRVRKRKRVEEEVDRLEEYEDARFLGEPVPDDEARQRWPHRYRRDWPDLKASEEVLQARCHYVQAEVDGQVFLLEDDAYIKGDSEEENFIGKIIEIFEAVDGSQKFTTQWYYRANDTVIQNCGHSIDDKCVFFSEVKDENLLECLVKKVRIVPLHPRAEPYVKRNVRATCDFYYDKMYLLPYTSFVSLNSDDASDSGESGSAVSTTPDTAVVGPSDVKSGREKTLLDLYSGCGAMSTGICLGANSYGIKLVPKWAVDNNQYACKSLRLNHQETQVRQEAAEDFLSVIKEWEKLCNSMISSEVNNLARKQNLKCLKDSNNDGRGIYEVEEILDICYGNPNNRGNSALHFKIRWKGYGPEEDTWEPLEGLSACQEKLKQFVSRGQKSRILPLPGTVDVICGGPPCQGISGYNRFRNKDHPLNDPKNKQLEVFMDIVDYLKPKFVLMENVVDIVRFADGYLGRYAVGRLVSMGYQARMGLMPAGAYGLPQFRMRMFMWGALSTERLPQYPLPTHNVVVRGNVPTEFESNAVSVDVDFEVNLKEKLFLSDAISDLPPVENSEERNEMPYISDAETEFQRFIRLRRDEIPGCLNLSSQKVGHKLYDHRPLCLNQDDYQRVCHIPKKKGANFRDLPGVKVRADNKVEWDPDVERHTLATGKPLVPNYAMTFEKGSSSKPFGRLWWDETVATVVTRAEPHNQVILHPEQDRVLTIRENARLQGFPDYYKLHGPTKERYKQVGNAVAVPVARALGFSLARAMRGLSGEEPVFTLPEDYTC